LFSVFLPVKRLLYNKSLSLSCLNKYSRIFAN
jgi:hypothetical protein